MLLLIILTIYINISIFTKNHPLPQVMMYLDAETEQAMRQAAERAGLPYSRWVAGLIRSAARGSWPADFLKLAGSLPDAPLTKDTRATAAPDLPRIPP